MAIAVDIPGRERLELSYLVLDVNGTLTGGGVLLDGVAERLSKLGAVLAVHILSADTFGTLDAVSGELGVPATMVASGDEKARHVAELGAERCAAIGNGANDAAMLDVAALGIAVVGSEGAATSTLHAADIVCRSIVTALDLLLDVRMLAATLRR